MTILGAPGERLALTRVHAEELGRRTASAIQNGQLYEQAVTGTRARDEMLSTVSHDLKNPLGVILLSAARMLEPGPDGRPEVGRRQVEAIQRSAQRMRRLVADLLDVAALDGGAMNMRPARVDTRAVVEDALDAVRVVAAESGVTVDHSIRKGLPAIWVDSERMIQVLTNLLGNAIKFTPRGGRVRVEAHVRRDQIELSVVDSGVGIPPHELPRVFDRFWQAERTRKLGTGLGLAICKSLVELWGGRISATSELGAGTVMTFTVPLAGRMELVASRARA